MMKNINFILSTLILISYQALSQEVSVTQNMPATAEPGGEFMVEVTIYKGTTGGFAKLQQELPLGFTATVVEAKNGNFSFKDQKVKIIWMSLPPEDEYTISYNVMVDNDVSGVQSIGGIFQYLVNNERTSLDISPSDISIEEVVITAMEEEEEEEYEFEEEEEEEEEYEFEEEEEEIEYVEPEPEETTYQPPSPPSITSTYTSVKRGFKYQIQIGAYKNSNPAVDFKNLEDIGISIEKIVDEDGLTKIVLGGFSTWSEAKAARKEVIDKGITDAWIIRAKYRIQIAASRSPLSETSSRLSKVPEHTSQKYDDGYYRYFAAGAYRTFKAAKIALQEVIAKGIEDAWISQ